VASSGGLFTIRVRPYSDVGADPAGNMYVVLEIK
jgi:hypothetical protein